MKIPHKGCRWYVFPYEKGDFPYGKTGSGPVSPRENRTNFENRRCKGEKFCNTNFHKENSINGKEDH